MNKLEVLARLQSLANPKKAAFKAQKYAIKASNALGVYNSDLNIIARKIGRNNELGLELLDSDIYEAKILCSKIYTPKDVTESQMDTWVKLFDNWEICDSFCMGLFAKSPLALEKAFEWVKADEEFIKRSGFVIMAAYSTANKKAGNDVFESFFEPIEDASCDSRNFVKKAVNWALRSIGKRNRDLQKEAITVAKRILEQDSKSAQWIAKDALKELGSSNVRMSDYPRSIYRV